MWLFAPFYVLANAALNSATGPFNAILPDMVPSGQYGTASGWMGLMDMLGTTLGAAVMGLIAFSLQQRFGGSYVPILAILAAALLITLVITVWAAKVDTHTHRHAHRALLTLACRRSRSS
jgi:sugar phosphate permease